MRKRVRVLVLTAGILSITSCSIDRTEFTMSKDCHLLESSEGEYKMLPEFID